ncbi:unnamed protein product [Diatraea saccharalis]|uniref:FAD synthase n=1 Tax=Diatraea saccharalis TaxID=40085 RepID=A0A9N9WA91_9NEOP|nr:unnamed protein product [Diatraea saccharalis]
MPQQRYDDEMEYVEYDGVLQEAEQIIRQCFKQFRLEEVFLSFNGGKDCTALLDITINVLTENYSTEDVKNNIKVVYIRTKHPFREIEEFVEEIQSHYGITLTMVEGELKTTLQNVLEQDGTLKACLMGTRRTDPYSSDLEFMQKTDSNWPQLIRVSPILNWSYHQIWSYILKRKVPYCSLYDKGYTSIGSSHNTWPNPALAYKDRNGILSYLPAWRLSDAALERAGRTPPSTKTTNGIVANGENGHCHCSHSVGDTF